MLLKYSVVQTFTGHLLIINVSDLLYENCTHIPFQGYIRYDNECRISNTTHYIIPITWFLLKVRISSVQLHYVSFGLCQYHTSFTPSFSRIPLPLTYFCTHIIARCKFDYLAMNMRSHTARYIPADRYITFVTTVTCRKTASMERRTQRYLRKITQHLRREYRTCKNEV